ncbi:hypothetical protein [Reinekea marinisedimentorum]|uniref:Uncharacterized protein n=1 Tax=Reinekea marinisedimentorum TaxID=230495 RepID=A0A4R3HSW6_9GAMM|nr:hypothetical protein [Reinekea marinisedimentorum]TCS36122.1 hypothetical protein BCF53_1273 [Reinekea marinisedimentorum]
MKLTKTTILLLSSLLVFGCNDSSDDDTETETTDTTETTETTETTYSQSALIADNDSSDTGELRYKMDSALSAATLSLSLMYASDEDETAKITLFGSSAANDHRLAEILIDSDDAPSGEGYVGISLKGNQTVSGTNEDDIYLTEVAADTWVDISLTWDISTLTYYVTIDGTQYASQTTHILDIDDDNIFGEVTSEVYETSEDASYFSVRISTDSGTASSTTPLYIDDINLTSAETEILSDDFEGYETNYALGTGDDENDPYHSNSYSATVSDAQNATE